LYDDPTEKKKPIKFADLKLKNENVKGDKVYQEQTKRLRDKKAGQKVKE